MPDTFRLPGLPYLALFLLLLSAAPSYAFNVYEGGKLKVQSNLIMGMDYRYQADYFPGRSGFRITDARFNTEARYLDKLRLTLKLDFADLTEEEINVLKTAQMEYRFSDPLRLSGGYGKIPFGQEYSRGLTSRPNIYHSEASALIAPGRSVGLNLSGKRILGHFCYDAGFYNGTTDRWDKNESGLHMGAANLYYQKGSFKGGYNLLYSLDETFAQGVYVDLNHQINKKLTLKVFSEYMEQRYFNYHWNHSVFTLFALRINSIEPLLYFDYYNDNVGYDGEEDKLIPGIGFNAYFLKDKVQLKTDLRTEYLYSTPTFHNQKFYNSKLTVKLVVSL
ncbi:MAG: hypothetical protein PQJ58_15715 [Spirochaetales bacterium]|nr:hypothetical protein [Spirochaetales bacterium]